MTEEPKKDTSPVKTEKGEAVLNDSDAVATTPAEQTADATPSTGGEESKAATTATETSGAAETAKPESVSKEVKEKEEAQVKAKEEAEKETPAKSRAIDKRAAMNELFKQIRIVKRQDLPEEKQDLEGESTSYQKLMEEAMQVFSQKSLVKGRVISIGEKEIIVDFGFKSEGMVPKEEFSPDEMPQVGDTLELFLDQIEDDAGLILLSKKKADFMRVWQEIKKHYERGELVEGTITRRIKGGMVVNVNGVNAFLPGSQLDVRPVRDFDSYIGKTFKFKIVKINDFRKNVVLSRKEILKEALEEKRRALLENLEIGKIVEGRVKNITDFGVFVDLGGVDGLLHITDLSWGRVNHPSEIVKLDETITVKIIDYDRENQRVSLGLKQLQPHPWDHVEEKYPPGSRVKGKVVGLKEYGAFIELEEGVEGLVHVSALSWTQHIKHPSDVLKIGDEVEVLVLSVDRQNQKISLSIKDLQPDPWSTIEERYVVSSVHEGVVKNILPYGAFVELEPGIEGLVHISDLSWTRKVRHPREVLRKSQRVKVKILDLNPEQHRISLGIKQVTEDPWPAIKEHFAVNSVHKGKVIRLLDKGIILEFPDYDVEGIVPLNEFRKRERKNILQQFEIGQEVEVKVVRVDANDKKIVVSHEAAIKDRERAEIEEYLRGQQTEAVEKIELPEEVVQALKAEEEAQSPEEAESTAATEKSTPAEAEEETPPETEEAPAEAETKTKSKKRTTKKSTAKKEEPQEEAVTETEEAEPEKKTAAKKKKTTTAKSKSKAKETEAKETAGGEESDSSAAKVSTETGSEADKASEPAEPVKEKKTRKKAKSSSDKEGEASGEAGEES